MKASIDEVKNVIAAFVTRTRGLDGTKIQADTELLRDGYLDSFSVVSLSTEIEQALKLSLPSGTLLPEDFESVQVLYDRLIEATS
ncbi:MAG: acyl carrier protein [Sandaracinaceae bacterium]|jgi:acyl carrier protein|nr:acyl carrier protein [Sandaracinaceae bacterium]